MQSDVSTKLLRMKVTILCQWSFVVASPSSLHAKPSPGTGTDAITPPPPAGPPPSSALIHIHPDVNTLQTSACRKCLHNPARRFSYALGSGVGLPTCSGLGQHRNGNHQLRPPLPLHWHRRAVLSVLPATYSCDQREVHRPVQSHSMIQGAFSGAESGSLVWASGAMTAVQRLRFDVDGAGITGRHDAYFHSR